MRVVAVLWLAAGRSRTFGDTNETLVAAEIRELLLNGGRGTCQRFLRHQWDAGELIVAEIIQTVGNRWLVRHAGQDTWKRREGRTPTAFGAPRAPTGRRVTLRQGLDGSTEMAAVAPHAAQDATITGGW